MTTSKFCPKCGDGLTTGQDGCDCGWIRPRPSQQEPSTGISRAPCARCHGDNPALRELHWLELAGNPADLENHLRLEFPKLQEDGLKRRLAYSLDLFRQYAEKHTDESGHYLPPAQAFAAQMKADYKHSARYAMEQEIQAHIRRHDLKRRPGEPLETFKRRCLASIPARRGVGNLAGLILGTGKRAISQPVATGGEIGARPRPGQGATHQDGAEGATLNSA